MNIKKPRTARIYEDNFGLENKREFSYKYIHFYAPAMSKIAAEFTPHENRMVISLANSIGKNNNILLNLVGKPAESRNEILCALGYRSKSNTPKGILSNLFNKGVIKRVKNENAFCGYVYYVNPYIMYYGSTVDDTTIEVFHDSEWKEL